MRARSPDFIVMSSAAQNLRTATSRPARSGPMATFDATSPVRGWGCVCRAAMRSRSHVESSRPGCYDCMSADNPVCVKVAAEGIRGMLCRGPKSTT
jgi:hypothetical protein